MSSVPKSTTSTANLSPTSGNGPRAADRPPVAAENDPNATVLFGGRPLSERQLGTYRRVRQLLDENRAADALGVVRAAGLGDPLLKNFHGVCLLRAGQPDQAVRVFRELVLVSNGVCLRTDAPTVFKTNFATALLLSGNVSGCISILDETGDEQNPGVQRLRRAIDEWKSELSFWQKLAWKFGTEPNRPLTLDHAPGDLL